MRFTSYKAVALRRRQSRDRNDVTSPQLTGSDPDVTSFHASHLDMAVKCRKLAYDMRFASYKAVARRKTQSSHKKSRRVTSGDRK